MNIKQHRSYVVHIARVCTRETEWKKNQSQQKSGNTLNQTRQKKQRQSNANQTKNRFNQSTHKINGKKTQTLRLSLHQRVSK